MESVLLLVAVVLPPTVLLEPEPVVATTCWIAPEDPAAQYRAHVAGCVFVCGILVHVTQHPSQLLEAPVPGRCATHVWVAQTGSAAQQGHQMG